MKVVEKFISINGEGRRAGELAVFIRFKGCNLNCSYCDTKWANEPACDYEELSPDKICEYVSETGIKNVTLTGGEPLLQKDIRSLVEKLLNKSDIRVEIETNGAVDIAPLANAFSKEKLSLTMDYKLPSSGCEEKMLLSNMEALRKQDTVKFVSGSINDLECAEKIIEKFHLTERCQVFISSVFGSIEPVEIVNFMTSKRMNDVRLQIQMHKVIWNQRKGAYNVKNPNIKDFLRANCAFSQSLRGEARMEIMMIDTKAIEEHIRGILVALGDDPEREGLKDTPKRVAKMYEEVFLGMNYSNHEIAQMFDKTFEDGIEEFDTSKVVVMKDIDLFSYCEHHMALMYDMKATVAYIPNGKVIGLSKIARICDMVGRRLQLQERIGQDIADIMTEITGSEDVAVVLEGYHSCVSARGIKKNNTRTMTVELRGSFKDDAALQMYLR